MRGKQTIAMYRPIHLICTMTTSRITNAQDIGEFQFEVDDNVAADAAVDDCSDFVLCLMI